MKRKFLAVGLVGFVTCSVFASKFLKRETMPLLKVCERWGERKFEISSFKSGDESVKASMTCDLLKNQKQFIGINNTKIRSILGDYDGHYFSESFPTYIIRTATSIEDGKKNGTWQLLFLLDRKQNISEIVVHKNCCDL